MLSEKELRLLDGLKRETLRIIGENKITKREYYMLKVGMGTAIWECLEVYNLDMNKIEFFKEINRFVNTEVIV